jgi:hypothetical protein
VQSKEKGCAESLRKLQGAEVAERVIATIAHEDNKVCA